MFATHSLLEWPQIQTRLQGFCLTPYGRSLAQQPITFSQPLEVLQQEQHRVEESKNLLLRWGEPTLGEVPNMVPILQRLAKHGDLTTLEETAECLQGLLRLRQLARFFIQNRSVDLTPNLNSYLQTIQLPNDMIEAVETVITERGDLRPGVSPDFQRYQERVQALGKQIQQQLQRLVTHPTTSKYLQEPIYTQRNGRWVVPVKAEHKVDVPGTVHDTSASGVTLFIEPKQVVETSNQLVAAQRDLEREIQRILGQLSQTIQPFAEATLDFVTASAQLDYWLAKARLSRLWDANPVTLLSQPGCVHLQHARHPILLMQGNTVVPNTITLQPPNQVILITGPNTGGKTVVLKLLGLCVLLVHAGLHLPVAMGSSMSVFTPLCVDIGDSQNITQNLSTFSGHIQRLNQFLNQPLSQALILIDEICAGTDPQEGSALAQAVLEAYRMQGAVVVVTTHIGELKVFAHQTPGYINASVAFDAQTLQPTYQLLLGIPGSSHALTIAERLGMPSPVIQRARRAIDTPQHDAAELIEALETKNRALHEALTEAQRLRDEVAWEEAQLKDQLNRLEGEKRKTLQMFREGLKDKLRFVEQEVDDLKHQMQADKAFSESELQQMSQRFKRVQDETGELFVAETQQLYPTAHVAWEVLKVGDQVESKSLNLVAHILELQPGDQKITLQAGILKTVVPLSDLIRKIEPQTSRQPAKNKATQSVKSRSAQSKVPESQRQLSMQCDVRGLQSDEAIAVLDNTLDEALLSNTAEVHVVHGHGTGALKKAIRSHLRALPYVKQYGPASAMEGGDGKTIVVL